MQIINQKIIINRSELNSRKTKNIEIAARTCYKSENKATKEPNHNFIRGLINSGHESVIEHEKITVRIITSRAITHELVRHRLASYSQESTRYCNYTQDRFGGMQFIRPYFKGAIDQDMATLASLWKDGMAHAESTYNKMIAMGANPEEARGVLPNDLKTEIVVTMNMRAWRHFLKIRKDKTAVPQIRFLAQGLLCTFQQFFPSLFDDIQTESDIDIENYPDLEIIEDVEQGKNYVSKELPPIQKTYTLGAAIDRILQRPELRFKNLVDGGELFYSCKDERMMYLLNDIEEIFTVEFFNDRLAKFIEL